MRSRLKGVSKFYFSSFLILSIFLSACSEKTQINGDAKKAGSVPLASKEVKDMRGKKITIPKDPKKVIIIDKGFLLQNMVAMKVENKIIATGGIIKSKLKRERRDSITLFPRVYDLPQVGYPTGAVDFEAIAAVRPDLVILRNSEYIKDSEITKKAIETIENQLKIPLVVINGSGCYDKVELEKHYEGIKVLGEVFDKSERANEIIKLMDNQVKFIQKRIANIKEEEKPRVMYIGLHKEGEVGSVWGRDMGDAKFVREYAGIKNAYDVHKRTKMSAEQLVSLNPDVIILGTNTVVPHVDIFKEKEYKNLSKITAIKNNRVASLGLLTWWGDWRLEVPVILTISAKAAYPEKFADLKVGKYIDEYHKKLYSLDDEKIQELKRVQHLNWLDEKGF